MICVALKAARLGGFGSGMVAGTAGRNARQKQVRTLLAGQCSGMAACARHEFMLRVIEFRVRHIASRDVRWRDFRQRRVASNYKRVALLARLAPQELFRLSGAFADPLLWRQQAIVRGNRLFRQVAVRIARDAQVGGMRRDVGLKFCHDERVNHFRSIVRDRIGDPLVELQGVTRGASMRVSRGRHIRARRSDNKRIGFRPTW